MPSIPADGKIRIAWVPSISNKAAPTAAELNAGLLLSSLVVADGLIGFEATSAEVDDSAIDSTFDYKSVGRSSFSGTMLRLKKQSGTDTAFDTLVREAAGYIVIRRYVASTTSWAAGQKVNVYPVICGETRELPPEANTMSRYEVPMMVNADPVLRATVV